MESPHSPKRRRILSSINPPEPGDDAKHYKRHRTISRDRSVPRMEDSDAGKQQKQAPEHDTTMPRPTKLRFKSRSSGSGRSRRANDEEEEGDLDDRRRRHRHHHRRRSRTRSRDRNGHADDEDNRHRRGNRRSHRRKRSHSPTPAPPADAEPVDPFQDPPLSPETAFRESLFDALADDEGAAYWESVYGQPIHIYPAPGTGAGGGGGMLERMTDEEYAAYVRQRMWEKTHAGLLEAQARRKREREEERRRLEEGERVAREMERSLRFGEERRKKRARKERWRAYLDRWQAWEEGKGKEADVGGIPWPDGAESGGGSEVSGEAVRAFFVNGIGLEELGEKEFAAALKEERVRWHPDKMQQRLGGKVDEKVMRNVTAIFQVVDALWNETRKHRP